MSSLSAKGRIVGSTLANRGRAIEEGLTYLLNEQLRTPWVSSLSYDSLDLIRALDLGQSVSPAGPVAG